VAQLGPSGYEGAEAERAERTAVVGDEGDRHDLAGILIGPCSTSGYAEQPLALGQGELDGGDRVVLVGGRWPVPAELDLGPVIGDTGDAPGASGRVSYSEKSSCQTWFGPVGGVVNAALRPAASWRRSRW
jgi:hypothetical protein